MSSIIKEQHREALESLELTRKTRMIPHPENTNQGEELTSSSTEVNEDLEEARRLSQRREENKTALNEAIGVLEGLESYKAQIVALQATGDLTPTEREYFLRKHDEITYQFHLRNRNYSIESYRLINCDYLNTHDVLDQYNASLEGIFDSIKNVLDSIFGNIKETMRVTRKDVLALKGKLNSIREFKAPATDLTIKAPFKVDKYYINGEFNPRLVLLNFAKIYEEELASGKYLSPIVDSIRSIQALIEKYKLSLARDQHGDIAKDLDTIITRAISDMYVGRGWKIQRKEDKNYAVYEISDVMLLTRELPSSEAGLVTEYKLVFKTKDTSPSNEVPVADSFLVKDLQQAITKFTDTYEDVVIDSVSVPKRIQKTVDEALNKANLDKSIMGATTAALSLTTVIGSYSCKLLGVFEEPARDFLKGMSNVVKKPLAPLKPVHPSNDETIKGVFAKYYASIFGRAAATVANPDVIVGIPNALARALLNFSDKKTIERDTDQKGLYLNKQELMEKVKAEMVRVTANTEEATAKFIEETLKELTVPYKEVLNDLAIYCLDSHLQIQTYLKSNT